MSKPRMEAIIRDAIELAHQAGYDFCGEQREFHLPRARRIVAGLAQWFPMDFAKAFQTAKDGYGDLIAKE